jgi:hypothetical protein
MTSSLTDQQLADIAARHQAATEGPWTVSEDYSDVLGPDGDQLASYWNPTSETRNGEFIAHARQDVPALLAMVRRQQDQIRFLLTVLAKKDADSGAGDRALAEFLAEETHVVADDSDDPEHVDDYPGRQPAAPTA